MRAIILLFISCMLGCTLFSQKSGESVCSEANIGTTKYDQQTNKSCLNRIYRHPDGTIGAVWMLSQSGSPFDDRGTGYNYFNGYSWGSYPASRIESVKSGWASYAPYGPNGEIIISHKALLGPLNLYKRTNKGSGSWSYSALPLASGTTGFLWPRMVTGGPNHMYIHVIANTAPTSNGGTYYQGLNGAILYNRSLDGGASWSGWQLLPGMTSTTYLGFNADIYAWAEPRGDTLCFVVGDSWQDLFIMKSNNNGTTWTKTMVWHCNYNKWTGGSNVGLFYCPDGANAVALDNSGKAHVVFGRQRASGSASGTKSWYPMTDGLIYWHEGQAQLIQSLDSATLSSGNNFIGWVQDPNVWYAGQSALPYYYLSMSSMPVITIDQNGHIFVVWSGVTNNRDPYNYMLRHLFARASVCNGDEWCPDIVDLTSGSYYNTLECAYPEIASSSTNDLYLTFQSDGWGGNYVRGLGGAQGQTSMSTNDIRFMTVQKSTMISGSAPQVDFSADILNPVVNQTVTFTDLSANCPSAWQWSFSPSNILYVDGTSYASKKPHVQFTAVGTYSVMLTTSNAFGTGTLTKTNYITVSPPPPPVASFIANQTNIVVGEKILFTDQSTGYPTTWLWTFEGGTPSTWNGKNPPLIEYTASGNYNVSLEVSNQWGSNSKIKADYIKVTDPPLPVADFSADTTIIKVGRSVTFTDLSTNYPATWSWSFEGGDPTTSMEKEPPPVIYDSTGTFSVSLVVSNITGSDTMTKTDYITVIPLVQPSAFFTATPRVLYEGDSVEFTDLSANNPVSWEWIFEGGTPSISALQSPPPIIYSLPGEYDVTLTVINEDGSNSITKTKYITVLHTGSPMAKFSASQTTIEVGNTVQFTDQTTGSPSGWTWTFEGGTPGSYDGQSPPSVSYDVAGYFDVSLQAFNQFGSHTSAVQDYITVTNHHMPVAGFACDKTSIRTGDSVLFTNESTGYPSTWLWTFEGGSPGSSDEKTPPPVVYNTGGVFGVTLTVTNLNGTNTLTKVNYISVSGIGIEKEHESRILVYPNPAAERITIEVGWLIGEVRIVDVLGKRRLTCHIEAKSGSVNLVSMIPGIYFLCMKKDSKDIIRKITVQ